MSNALAKIYNRQQEAIAVKTQKEQAARDKQQREITAFQNSGIPALFIELADVPLVDNRACRTLGDRVYSYGDPRRNSRSRELALHSGSGQRWWCEESPDSGLMRYAYGDNGGTNYYSTAEGPWFDSFLEYVARVCAPAAIAQLHGAPAAVPPAKSGKRKLQPIQ
jgi:hypothetical protein